MENKNNDLSSLRIDRTQAKNPEARGKKINLIITILIILLILAAAIWGYNSIFNPAVEVNLTAAVMQSPSQSSATLTANGYVVAQRKASIASKGTGKLVYLGVVEGDKVKKGQIIGRLEDNDIQAALAAAKANLKFAEASLKEAENNYKRQKALLKTGSATPMQVDQAEAAYLKVVASIDVAKANVQAQEVNIENTLIRAPFNGTVLTKDADVGEIVAPFGASVNAKSAVVTLADMSSLQVEADVSESNIEKVKINQPCQITLDANPQKNYEGYVAKIVPTADRSKATIMVKVGFKDYDENVLPEMSAKVSFFSKPISKEQQNEKPILVVPFTSVVNRNGKDVVFKVKDDKAVEVPVVKGRELNTYDEIKSGLHDGDRVIEKVTEDIKDGTKVSVK